jgi:hypothetical protein
MAKVRRAFVSFFPFDDSAQRTSSPKLTTGCLPTISAEDELQNVNLADEEAVAAAKERKRKAKAAYTGYDDDEFDPERVGIKADVLGKYDDEYLGGGKNQVGRWSLLFYLGVATRRA